MVGIDLMIDIFRYLFIDLLSTLITQVRVKPAAPYRLLMCSYSTWIEHGDCKDTGGHYW